MSTADGQFKELQYEVTPGQMGENGMCVNKRIPSREAVVEIANYAEKEIEPIIYKFVYRFLPPSLTTTDVEANKEFSYYLDILKKDDKFMKVVAQRLRKKLGNTCYFYSEALDSKNLVIGKSLNHQSL